ncbi:ligand-binding sensor domain-containing protein [Petrocella sp. FN5]|uniref:ligand-binding sensor domain-containing protein n=1 Tax=Petrocella sp. FN5 TaxID=3032002 RepID=UPI0023D9E23C|nr:two-component regulator propeller domain-containing protein [Petrocella sp. FN5]MDF1617794.1 two-component regulator propeller domain-containing protein [Petrocella sp. FN5]
MKMIFNLRHILFLLICLAVITLAIMGGRYFTALEDNVTDIEGLHIIRPPQDVNAMVMNEDQLWVGGRDGVYEIDMDTYTVIRELKLPKNVDLVKGLVMDENKKLWIGHFGGLTLFDLEKENYEDLEVLQDKRVNCIYKDDAGIIYIGTWGGVTKYDGLEYTHMDAEDGLLHDMVNVVHQDDGGGIWFGHYVAPGGGLSYLSNGKWQYFSTNEGMPHNNVTSIYQDQKGDVWVGVGLFYEGGLVKFTRDMKSWRIENVFIKDEDGLSGEKIRSLYEMEDGSFWIGSEYDGMTIIKDVQEITELKSTRNYFSQEQGLAGYEVKVMLEDEHHNLWLGTQNGVTVLEVEAIRKLLLNR